MTRAVAVAEEVVEAGGTADVPGGGLLDLEPGVGDGLEARVLEDPEGEGADWRGRGGVDVGLDRVDPSPVGVVLGLGGLDDGGDDAEGVSDLVEQDAEAVVRGEARRVVDDEGRSAPREEPRDGAGRAEALVVDVDAEPVEELPGEVGPAALDPGDEDLSPVAALRARGLELPGRRGARAGARRVALVGHETRRQSRRGAPLHREVRVGRGARAPGRLPAAPDRLARVRRFFPGLERRGRERPPRRVRLGERDAQREQFAVDHPPPLLDLEQLDLHGLGLRERLDLPVPPPEPGMLEDRDAQGRRCREPDQLQV
mmetsp:Transcript_6312/g.19131  ORF Transcript_6312/g.19131 Transcript_6312/m.19131 type:complete len:314 (-) Transcript_6312:53-994(-)